MTSAYRIQWLTPETSGLKTDFLAFFGCLFPTSNKKSSFNIIYMLFVANPFHCQYVIFSQINLKKFLHVCEDLGLSAWQLFDPQDLVAQDNVM